LSSQFVHVRLLRVLNKDQSINQYHISYHVIYLGRSAAAHTRWTEGWVLEWL